MICSMAKKAVASIKKLLKRYKDKEPVERRIGEKALSSGIVSEDLISDLISVDSMLCESASIADTRLRDKPEKLLEIISTHHIGLENLMQKLKLETRRSLPGTEFDPEYMTAHQNLVDTDDPKLHGTVARTVTPGYYTHDDYGEKLRKNECVMLYRLKEDSI